MWKLILVTNLFILNNMFSQTQEPIAKKSSKKLTKHKHERIDDYYWMNERDSKEVLDHLNKENAYCEKYFEPLNSLVDKLLKEFDQRINPNDVSAPFIMNGRSYQVKNIEGKDYQQIVQLEKGKETIFFDENERAKNQSFYELADWSPSPNNKLLALTEDFMGRRKYVATFRENSTGKFLKDKIQDVSGEIIWANDNKTVFYVKKDPQTLREFQVFRHVLGTDSKNDALVYEEKDEKFSLEIGKTITDKYIVIQIASSTTSETWLIDANQANTNPSVFLTRKQGHMYDIGHHEKGFYILSNSNATNKRLLFSKDVPKEIESCSEIIAHDVNTLLEGVSVFKNFLLIEERSNGLLKMKVKNIASGKEQFVQFNEETYFLSPGFNDNYDSDEI
ncbi:MAG: oligopeptidase B, partial [Bacteroidota bacterium]